MGYDWGYWGYYGHNTASAAPAEHAMSHIMTGEKFRLWPSAPLVCETLLTGSGWESGLGSGDSSEGSSDGVTNGGGSLFSVGPPLGVGVPAVATGASASTGEVTLGLGSAC